MQASRTGVEQRLHAASRTTQRKDDPATPVHGLRLDTCSSINNHVPKQRERLELSHEEWIDRLNDARCKWMIMLHRYSSSNDNGGGRGISGSNNPHRTLHQGEPRKSTYNTTEKELVPVSGKTGSIATYSSHHHQQQQSPGPSIQDQVTLSLKHQSNFSFCRSACDVPRESLVLGNSSREFIQHIAHDFEQPSESPIDVADGGQRDSRYVSQAIRQARRERMLRGLTPSRTYQIKGSPLLTQSIEKQGSGCSGRVASNPDSNNPALSSAAVASVHPATAQVATGSDATENPPGGNPASVNPIGDSGQVSMSKGIPSGDEDWSEELRKKDELISTLQRQLTALGEQPIEEVVTLEEAKKRLREAIDSLMAGDNSAETEHALEKWDKYVTNHPDHLKEQAAEEQAWETKNEASNSEALHLMKTFVPPNIFHAGLDGLRGGGLPPALAKRIFDRKVLWLIRAPGGMVSKTHVVELKSKFVANDLDIVESRALHACLPSTFENDADGAKTAWRAGFRKRLKELLDKEEKGDLKPAELRRPVYKDVIQGPFDPDEPAEEQETTRSGAFDAAEKPVVSGKLSAAKIAVVAEGLAAKLKRAEGSDGDEIIRSAPNSPASKYRRQSYALSRDQPTIVSMKNMISQLGSQLQNRRLRERRSSSFNESLDIPQILRDSLEPILPLPDPVAKHESHVAPGMGTSFEGSASAEKPAPETVINGTAVGPDTAVLAPQPTSSGVAAPRTDQESELQTKRNIGVPPSRKDMFAELALKAQALEERSSNPSKQVEDEQGTPPPLAPPPPPPPPLKLPPQQPRKHTGGTSDTVSMKEVMAELRIRAKARADQHAL